MNVVELRAIMRRRTLTGRGFPLCAIAILGLAIPRIATAAESAAAEKPAAATDDDAADNDEIISLSAYNAKADRIEDFGIRVGPSVSSKFPKTTLGYFFSRYAPIITAVVPNTAAAKAGLQPGEQILKSDGESLVGGIFSAVQLKKWFKTQKKKWAEVEAGKTNVTWTLEIQTPATRAVRIVKLVVPTPPPHWGASIWRMPEGRSPGTVAEPGSLAERSRAILDNGIWTLLDDRAAHVLDLDFRNRLPGDFASGREPTGYAWHIGNAQEGFHEIFVTQFRGRTEVIFYTRSDSAGLRYYLTSPSGALERAWQPLRKGMTGEIPLEEARVGFEHELDLWTTKIGKGTGRWPFEVKPGYDANAIFAVLAPKAATVAVEVVRPLAGEFLKLRSATEAERAMFTDAYVKLGAEQDRWAFTETSHGLADKRVTVTHVDPSKPGAERCVLLSINGKSPTPTDVQQWRDDDGDTLKPLGDIPPLTNIVDLKDLRVFKDETAAMVFELPIRSGNAEFPAEKFRALFRVNKTYRTFEDITVEMRDSIRVAGVVKITEAGLQARFQTLDPAHPSQPVSLKGGGAARILLVKISRDFETTRTDFKRVHPYVEADLAAPAAGALPIPVPGTR